MKAKTRKKLIGGIIWAATKQGSFQRSHIYSPGAKISDKEKIAFRNHIKSFCFKSLFFKYQGKSISESELISQIEELMSTTKEMYGAILKNSEFQFGNAQKFVNLYLKFLWIMGEIKEPPHFPVDRIIQKGLKPIRPWTNMNKEDYLEVINWARIRAKGRNQTLAEWEAERYNEILNSQ